MYRAFKYRLYPNKSQIELIENTFGCARLIYNLGLQAKMQAYKSCRVNLSAYDLMKQLPELKAAYDWLKEVDSQALKEALLQMETAYKNFFKSGMGYPKFRKKSNRQSFTAPNNKREVNFEKGTLTIPKISDIRMEVSRRFDGMIKRVTVSRGPSGRYYASILVETGIKVPEKRESTPAGTIGIDLGLKEFAVTSDDRRFENMKFLNKSLARLAILQQRLALKKKGSKNRKKARIKVARLHEKIANQRKDYLHKISAELVNDNQVDTICVETLAIKNMVKNPNIAGVIGDAGWGMFIGFLEYKCEWAGKNFVKIGRFEPSTKICNNCLAKNDTLTLADRSWTCASCNTIHDRDLNAARNIRDMGIKELSRRGTSAAPCVAG